jgi:hypothetical protein
VPGEMNSWIVGYGQVPGGMKLGLVWDGWPCALRDEPVSGGMDLPGGMNLCLVGWMAMCLAG